MKFSKLTSIVLFLIASASPRVLAGDAAQEIESLLPTMSSEKLSDRRGAEGRFESLCHRAARPGQEAERAALCRAIAEKLGPGTAKPARIWMMKQLQFIGRGEVAAALARALEEKDPHIRDYARRALEHNPSPEAAEALRKALDGAREPEWRLALVNALGARREPGSLSALMRHARSDDDGVRTAAIAALARLGDRSAVRVVAAGRTRGSERARRAATDAYLLLADTLCEKNEKAAALGIYRELLGSEGHLKCAAIIGLGRAGGTNELSTILEALGDDDPAIRGAGIAALEVMPPKVVLEAVARRLKTASFEEKIALLRVLGRHGDRSSLPMFVSAASDPDEAVRIVAIEALARVGDASTVPLLAEAAASAARRGRDAARASLTRLGGPDVESTMIDLAGKGDPDVRAELIKALAARRADAAVPMLLKGAEDRDEAVRVEAFKALAVLAGGEHLSEVVRLLVKAPGSRDAREAEKAVAAVSKRIEDLEARAGPVVSALRGSSDAVKCSLLRVLGRIGGTKALSAVRASVKDRDEEVRDAAVRALVDWPDAGPAEDLLELARGATKETHRVLALRGYVRVVGLPSDRPMEETLRLYEQGMKAARRDEERKLVLGGLGEVPHLDALRMVEPHLKDPALLAEAAAAAVKIARAIGGQHQEEAKAALQRVIVTCRIEKLNKEARDAISQLERYEGFITAWMLSGPYMKGRGDLFETAFPPEKPDAKDAKWRLITGGTSRDKPWFVDIKRALGGDNRAAYLRAEVYSPRSQKARLEMGSDDGIKAWLNGTVVHKNKTNRGVSPGQDVVQVSLNRGWNTLLLKITQGGGDWGACARFRAADGSNIDGLRVKAK